MDVSMVQEISVDFIAQLTRQRKVRSKDGGFGVLLGGVGNVQLLKRTSSVPDMFRSHVRRGTVRGEVVM